MIPEIWEALVKCFLFFWFIPDYPIPLGISSLSCHFDHSICNKSMQKRFIGMIKLGYKIKFWNIAKMFVSVLMFWPGSPVRGYKIMSLVLKTSSDWLKCQHTMTNTWLCFTAIEEPKSIPLKKGQQSWNVWIFPKFLKAPTYKLQYFCPKVCPLLILITLSCARILSNLQKLRIATLCFWLDSLHAQKNVNQLKVL